MAWMELLSIVLYQDKLIVDFFKDMESWTKVGTMASDNSSLSFPGDFSSQFELLVDPTDFGTMLQ
jgi:hypothetical protein